VIDVLRRHPRIWLIALLVALALAGAGVGGVLAAARAETKHRWEVAQGERRGWLRGVGFVVWDSV
jgi:hypothetical protein